MTVDSLKFDGSDEVQRLCTWLAKGAFDAPDKEYVRPLVAIARRRPLCFAHGGNTVALPGRRVQLAW